MHPNLLCFGKRGTCCGIFKANGCFSCNGRSGGIVSGRSGSLRSRRSIFGIAAHGIQTSNVVGIFQFRGLQNAHGVVISKGAHVANFTFNGSFECALCRIPCVYGGCRCSKSKVAICAACNKVDVLLCATFIFKVQTVTARCVFYVYVNTVGISSIGCTVIAFHGAIEVIFTSQSGREETKLICFSYFECANIGGLFNRCCLYVAANGAHVRYVVVTLCFNDVVFVAVTTACNLTGVKGITLFGAGSNGNNACAKVVVVALVAGFTGGSCHICGDFCAEENERKFGVVNKNVTGAGDGLDRVVTTKLPSINGVSFHPFKQNFKAFHYTGGAPSIGGVAPTNVNIKEDTCYVTAQVILAAGFHIGIVVAAALSVSFVATRTVFACRSGAEHHKIVFVIAAKTLTVGPGVLTVPSATAIPRGADRLAGIERGDLTAVVLAVGIYEQVSCCIITGDIAMVACHQLFQFTIQLTLRSIGFACAAGIRGEFCVGGVIILVEILCIGGEEGCGRSTSTPVVDVLAVGGVHVVYICGTCAQTQCRYESYEHSQYHKERQTAFHGLHK